MAATAPMPYAFPTLAGCGGEFLARPDDFSVEEIPLYLPAGQGEHLYLWVEKTGISTPAAVEHLCRAFGLAPVQVGHAGLKDAAAVARQWLSLHVPGELPLHRAETPAFRILATARHPNKLRTGHLRGNRFRMVVRGAQPSPDFAGLVETVAAHGFPNYFGPQRFGPGMANVDQGRRLVRGGFASARRLPRSKARFVTNAYQAALFNELVARRLEETGELARPLAGDLAALRGSGSFFPVTEAELPEATARAARGEVTATAPLFGYKVPLAEGVPGAWERELLAREGLTLERFRAPRKGLAPKGERRPIRAFPEELTWAVTGPGGEPGLVLAFTLGPGCYATSLLRELTHHDATLLRPQQAGPTAREASHGP